MEFRNDNRGLSLIEVVVIVGILAIMAATTASAASYMVRGNIKDAAKSTYSAIASNQTYAKAKAGDWTLTCAYNGTQFVLSSICDYVDASGVANNYIFEETLLSNRVTSVKYKDSTWADFIELQTIKFKKNTGAVSMINGNPVPSAGYADIQVAIEGNLAYLRLYYLTGEIEMY